MKSTMLTVTLASMFVLATTAVTADTIADQLLLPDDQGMWYFTIAGNPGYAIDGPVVNKLKSQTHYREIPENDPIYARYAPVIGRIPAVFIQEPDGYVVYKASGVNFPASLKDMAREIVKHIRARVSNSQCRPRPSPSPSPPPYVPLPDVAPMPDLTPLVPDSIIIDIDVVPEDEPDVGDERSVILLALAGLGGLLGGVVPDLLKGGE